MIFIACVVPPKCQTQTRESPEENRSKPQRNVAPGQPNLVCTGVELFYNNLCSNMPPHQSNIAPAEIILESVESDI